MLMYKNLEKQKNKSLTSPLFFFSGGNPVFKIDLISPREGVGGGEQEIGKKQILISKCDPSWRWKPNSLQRAEIHSY